MLFGKRKSSRQASQRQAFLTGTLTVLRCVAYLLLQLNIPKFISLIMLLYFLINAINLVGGCFQNTNIDLSWSIMSITIHFWKIYLSMLYTLVFFYLYLLNCAIISMDRMYHIVDMLTTLCTLYSILHCYSNQRPHASISQIKIILHLIHAQICTQWKET